ncbi:hypothetical protein GGI42DRAFT_308724 [Trichoderma sp. SZMC 28013]
MKVFYIVAGLSAFCVTEAATESTITCSACPPPSSMNEVITRSAVTTSSCSGASFTIISSQSGMSSSAVAPTGTSTATVTGIVPVSAGNRNIAVGMAGILTIAAVASYLVQKEF